MAGETIDWDLQKMGKGVHTGALGSEAQGRAGVGCNIHAPIGGKRAEDISQLGVQVRTQTLVKGAIIQIDATPFKQWYQTHYGAELGKKAKDEAKETAKPEVKVSGSDGRQANKDSFSKIPR